MPVAPRDFASRLGSDADEFVCLHAPYDFYAVGQYYAEFSQVDDDEVVACLEEALRRPVGTRRRSGGRPGRRTGKSTCGRAR
ncbi:hypothetical protein [Streptomyces sp. HUAS TT3]|uniref:hypothetical protein n=1 Tax=Streptomyces sp. HUAS TT3 TaxID=3447510 RepID=UPI003F65AACD